MKILKTSFFLIFLLLPTIFFSTCTNTEDGSSNSSNQPETNSNTDFFLELRSAITEGSIHCNQEACCWYDCSNDRIFCGQQSGLFYDNKSTLYNVNLDFMPSWWKQRKCFLIGPSEIGYTIPESYWVGCGCEINGFFTAYTWSRDFHDINEFNDKISAGFPEPNCSITTKSCSFCQPNCNGKSCGSNGCGGSCGTCKSGEYCSSTGSCTSNQISNNSNTNQDSCSKCLSNCSGLPSCCIGSGCLCQQECTVSSTDCASGTSFCCGPYGDCFCMANCPY